MRRLNPRRVKIHRTFTVEEVARLFGVHKSTVRGWLKAGLPRIDGRRPILILGRKVVGFLYARREGRRQRCRGGDSIASTVGRPEELRPGELIICRSRRVQAI